MTKPTDRQIKAVEDVLRGLVIITGDSTWDMNYVARKVLTAAAEVGETELERENRLMNDTIAKCAIEIFELQNKLAATIERCAQLIKQRADFWNQQAKDNRGICAESLADECEDLFAAIRALKDKP